MSNDITANRSALKDFLASIATISGDLSNITAPPFVLSEKSTVEIPQFWADKQELFVSQSKGENAEKRALSILKFFLCTLRDQQYAGRREEDGVKKPLNAFLGELFIGSWNNEEFGETRLVSEQVSHHPPVTACYLWNDKHGVRAEGFTQQEVTFNGNVSIKQKGHAILHLDKYNEDYLIPLPNIKVKGVLTGVPYPELSTKCSIPSSNGFVSHVQFSGKSMFGTGQKHEFKAKMFHVDAPGEVLYTADGAWDGEFVMKDARSDTVVDTINVNDIPSSTISVAGLDEQDPWESRRAWRDVTASLQSGNMKGVADAKSVVEEGQRQMRKDEDARNEQWTNIFFEKVDRDPIYEQLSKQDPDTFTVDLEGGFWKANKDAAQNMKKPFHGNLTPWNHFSDDSMDESSRTHGQNTPQNGAPATQPEATQNAQHRQVESTGDRSGRNSGVDVSTLKIDEQAKPQGHATPSPRQPTDAEVEAFLRARNSNLKQ